MTANSTSAKITNGLESVSKPVRLTRARRTAILKALSDPNRFQLLEQIASAWDAHSAACRHVPPYAISPATLSHHIKELENAGLIEHRTRGKNSTFSRSSLVVLDALIATLDSLARPSCKQG